MVAKMANMLQRIKAWKDPPREKMLQKLTFTHHQLSVLCLGRLQFLH